MPRTAVADKSYMIYSFRLIQDLKRYESSALSVSPRWHGKR